MRRVLFPAVLLLAAYFAVFGGEYGVADVRQTRALAAEAAQELAGIQEETRRLELRVEALEEDPRTLETLARERFGMIRDGEVLYRFAVGGPARTGEVDTSHSGR
ncbi:MAG: septum formation initiator family protein [Gemmatimonadales bacterium]|nr:MAG: septum formation initiator family protein [Gemmatimonadales bacterium]